MIRFQIEEILTGFCGYRTDYGALITITQVQAQENCLQLGSITGNQAGISGGVGIFNIDSNALVEISCQISSASGVGPLGFCNAAWPWVDRSFAHSLGEWFLW